MKQYKIQITDTALSDMEEIYNYIAEQLRAREAAMGQYNRIADAIESLDAFPERVKLVTPYHLDDAGAFLKSQITTNLLGPIK